LALETAESCNGYGQFLVAIQYVLCPQELEMGFRKVGEPMVFISRDEIVLRMTCSGDRQRD
jgi:hypothetical protein